MAVTLDTIAKKISNIENHLLRNEKINEEEACKLLSISKKTIVNYVSNRTIPASFYTVGVGGNRFYYKQKLMDLNIR